MKDTNVLVLSAGAIARDLASLFGEIPSGMVPVNSKPAIAWIIDSLRSQGFERFFVTTGFKKEIVAAFLDRAYAKRRTVTQIEVDFQKPPGNAIIEALPAIESNDVFVVLGDTIVKGDVTLDGSFVYTSKQFTDPTKWCLVKPAVGGTLEAIYDKQNVTATDGLFALVGAYYFKNMGLLRDVANEMSSLGQLQVSDLLERYNARDPIRCIEQKGWIDIGHLDRYHQAKILLAQPRQFNQLEHDPLRGVIKKRSANADKLRDEIQWYQHVPDNLKVLAPRMLESRFDHDPYLTIEYYGYPTLSELFIYGAIHLTIWKEIVAKIMGLVRLFLEHRGSVSEEDYHVMYVEKTKERLERAYAQNSELKALAAYPEITVNGDHLKNISSLFPFIENMAQQLYQQSAQHNCFLHGDLCFSNILFDSASGIVRLIDPRGRWGHTPYGDIRYDLAKLRHSVAGKYDHIINDFFAIEREDDNVFFDVYTHDTQTEIAELLDEHIRQQWDVAHIQFIEGLLFLSMIPLHPERPERQLAMFCTGLARINQVYQQQTML